jgi:hypothetical protein
VIENFELLCRLSVVSGSQCLVRHFPFVPKHFLQRKSVSIQLLGKVQQRLQIYGIGRLFLGDLTARRAFGFSQGAVTVPKNTARDGLKRSREGKSLGFHAWLL